MNTMAACLFHFPLFTVVFRKQWRFIMSKTEITE
jgi:hypothetical protein